MKNQTEEKIIQSAEEIFLEKGFDGARMREISDRAGINKGLLHYYFKSKDKLFEQIFYVAFNRMIGKMNQLIEQDMPIEEKLSTFIDRYLDFLEKHPLLPRFLMHEMTRKGQKFVKSLSGKIQSPAIDSLKRQVNVAVEKGEIKAVDVDQLLLNTIALCVFPFIAKPMVQVILSKDEEHYRQLIQGRREQVKEILRQSIQINL